MKNEKLFKKITKDFFVQSLQFMKIFLLSGRQ